MKETEVLVMNNSYNEVDLRIANHIICYREGGVGK